jgi:hypothetical protein
MVFLGRLKGPLMPKLRRKVLEYASALPGDGKAPERDLLGRFREIVSDPLNLLIERHPRAGMVEHGLVWLHNGNRVPAEGEHAYYGHFSDVLVFNRGVHEPLEEYVFQEVLRIMPEEPTMLELGAYWAHYSMWMKIRRPRTRIFMVEPDAKRLETGRMNFARNGYEGSFVQASVGKGQFEVDRFVSEQGHPRLNILHSDIQGFELEMLEGAADSFRSGLIDHVFVSTHSQSLHDKVEAKLNAVGMRVEVSSEFDFGTTSNDGFVFASRPALAPVFPGFSPLGRRDILLSNPEKLVSYVTSLQNLRELPPDSSVPVCAHLIAQAEDWPE